MAVETHHGGGRDAQRHAFWITVSFVGEARWRFRDNEGAYKRLVDLLMMFDREEITKADLRVQLAALFKGHQDLLDRFDGLPWDALQRNGGAAAAAPATEGKHGKVSQLRPKKKNK